jgi:hypothetical protein
MIADIRHLFPATKGQDIFSTSSHPEMILGDNPIGYPQT